MKETASESAPAAETRLSSAEDVAPPSELAARRERVKALHLEGGSIAETAAALGVHRSTILNDRKALGLQSPRGPKPKQPHESRPCDWCGHSFLAKGSEVARGGGRFCSPHCGVEASNPTREILTSRERREVVAAWYVLQGLTMAEIGARLGVDKALVTRT